MSNLHELCPDRRELELRIGGKCRTGKDVLACRSERVEWDLRGRGTECQSGSEDLPAHVDDQDGG
jgi:hypothetical protein